MHDGSKVLGPGPGNVRVQPQAANIKTAILHIHASRCVGSMHTAEPCLSGHRPVFFLRRHRILVSPRSVSPSVIVGCRNLME